MLAASKVISGLFPMLLVCLYIVVRRGYQWLDWQLLVLLCRYPACSCSCSAFNSPRAHDHVVAANARNYVDAAVCLAAQQHWGSHTGGDSGGSFLAALSRMHDATGLFYM